jgi:hypothetical protein
MAFSPPLIDWEAESYPAYPDFAAIPFFVVFFLVVRFFLDRFVFEVVVFPAHFLPIIFSDARASYFIKYEERESIFRRTMNCEQVLAAHD